MKDYGVHFTATNVQPSAVDVQQGAVVVSAASEDEATGAVFRAVSEIHTSHRIHVGLFDPTPLKAASLQLLTEPKED